MVGKRSIGTGLTPGRTATPPHAVVSDRSARRAGSMSAAPFPVDTIAAMASPRAGHTSAPPRGKVVQNPLNGATANSSRGHRATGPAVPPRVSIGSTLAIRDTWQSRVPKSPRASRKSLRCRACTDAIGGSAKGIWGDRFGTEDEARGRMRDSEEVVSCLSTTVGTDRTHGVLRDSGVARSTDPGASFSRQSRIEEIPAETKCGDNRSSCWLLGGGFLGGRKTHLKTPSTRRD